MKVGTDNNGRIVITLSAYEAGHLHTEIGELPSKAVKTGRSRKLIQIYQGLELLLQLKEKP